MANLTRNFVLGKMNKVVDERLVPNGEYIDALNIRMGSTEQSEIGVIENTKGNERLTTLRYIDGTSLSANARCIGAVEDSEAETVYWFVHDPTFTVGATGKLDMIVSYNMLNNILTYHVVSIDDGNNARTTLNFSPEYLITGVNLIKTGNNDEVLIYFTDNYNQPRFINNLRRYNLPAANIDQFTNESILVIKKPPVQSPTVVLSDSATQENFLDFRFVSFAYRYRYADNEYSAISQFSEPAFQPLPFDLSVDSNLNEGMINAFNKATITYNSGSSLVKSIELLFKDMSTSVIKVIEKLNKKDLGIPDNTDRDFEFVSSKIFTVLPESELLRLYDNVPLLAKAQTIMGNRLMYGNYTEGYDLVTDSNQPVQLTYVASLQSTLIGLEDLTVSKSNGSYNLNGPVTATDSVMEIDLTDASLVSGSSISIEFTIQHGQFSGGTPSVQTGLIEYTFNYFLSSSYTSVYDLATSPEFQSAVGTISNIQPMATACDGSTLTDIFNCDIPNTLDVYTKDSSGIATIGEPIAIITSPSSNIIGLQLPAVKFIDNSGGGGADAYEYYEITFLQAQYQQIANPKSLHSNRGYEIGIVYMDEFNRSSTALVSQQNAVYVPCGSSSLQNSIQVAIPPSQRPPYWASRYKFVIKPDRENYETIYSSIFFADPDSNATYFLLEGENAQKIESGDRLIVKVDTGGPTRNCLYATVLEKEAKAEDFVQIPSSVGSGNVPVPSGVYMKINANQFSTVRDELSVISLGKKEQEQKIGKQNPILSYTVNISDGAGSFEDYDIPAGSRIKMDFNFRRWGSGDGNNECERRIYDLSLDLISSGNYSDFKSWWDGDNIEQYLNDGSQTVGSGGCSIDNVYISTLAASGTDIPVSLCTNYFRFYRSPSTNGLVLLITGTLSCDGFVSKNNRASYVSADITIFRADSTIVFETEPQDALPDVFYENNLSFAIESGFHEGNVQNQTLSLSAIIDTGFFNCFAFGNGVESYKIRDSIVGKPLTLGNRVTSVSAKQYKRAERYADITYSGIFNDESNINKLNEFNLGLLNFKALEDSFGPIYVLDGRETDMLTIQEDKIGYVLVGKNLLSDAAAGGAITSVPEVLGTHIARTEKYGISFNPESYVNWGYDRFFTDVKRGAVLQLRGNSYSNDQLEVISEQGMRSWFRDTFIESFDKQKLGGYDPYMTEYVLVSNERDIPLLDECVDCGISKTLSFLSLIGESLSYCINLGEELGDFSITYEVLSINPGVQFKIDATYNATTSSTGFISASGSLSVSKDNIVASQVDIVIETTGPVVLSVNVECPITQTLDVIQVVVTNGWEAGETIHTEYYYTDTPYIGPVNSYPVTFASGTVPPIVSRYDRISGPQGNGAIPTDNSTVFLGTNKYASDTYNFDPLQDKFRYHRGNTLYNNNQSDINSLLSVSSIATPSLSPIATANYGSFNAGNTGIYLYLIWDLRDVKDELLCYSNISAEDACCNCTSPIGYVIDGPSLGSSTTIYTDASMTTFAADGYYSDGSIVRELISGSLQPQANCPTCSQPCNTGVVTATGDGSYDMGIDLGASTGAVLVKVTLPAPNAIPIGIKAEYNGTVYNGGSSPTYFKLQGAAGLHTYIGSSSLDCGVVANSPYVNIPVQKYNGTSFINTGLITSISVVSPQLKLTLASPFEFYMVIPKISASIPDLNVNIQSLCGGSATFDIEVSCPFTLPFGLGSLGYGTAFDACSQPTDQNIYYVHVNGAAGVLGLADLVFQDSDGLTPLADGFYQAPAMLGGNDWFQVENGVLIQIGNCIYGTEYRLRRCGDGAEIFADYVGATLSVGTFVDTIGDPTCTWEIIALVTAPVINDTINGILPVSSCQEGCGVYLAVNNDTVSRTFTYYSCLAPYPGTTNTVTLPPGYSLNFQSYMDPSIPKTGAFSITWTGCP